MDYQTVKDEIINFVVNSSEEVNSKVAIFIAGMQAQKNPIDCCMKTDNLLCRTNGNGLSGTKIASVGK